MTLFNMLKTSVETGSEKQMDRRLLDEKKAEDSCALEMPFLYIFTNPVSALNILRISLQDIRDKSSVCFELFKRV